jgi:dihydroorotate dehydrogenase electron transfer subunit
VPDPADDHGLTYPHSHAELVARRRDAEGLSELIFDGWWIARNATPGQFASLRTPRLGTAPLLRRPMSIAFVEGDHFGILVQNVGTGSRAISEAPIGERFDILGPVGRGFDCPPPGGRVALVGGGVGLAPLRFLYEQHRADCEWEILVGARRERLIPFRHYLETGGCSHFATDDGSAGLRGTAVDLLRRRHAEEPFARIYTCGPPRMIEAVVAFASEHGIDCHISLEARMACAMGQCLGCVVAKPDGGYVRVCTEGPCFRADEVVLGEAVG